MEWIIVLIGRAQMIGNLTTIEESNGKLIDVNQPSHYTRVDCLRLSLLYALLFVATMTHRVILPSVNMMNANL
jgi:hypothetical protein